MSGDARQVAPHAYKVIEENDKVRILENRMRPGEQTEMHSHPAVVGIGVTHGKFRFTSPDGQSMEIELNPGQAAYMPATEHSTENIGDTESHTVLVELK